MLPPPNHHAESNTVGKRNLSNWGPIRAYGWISWHLNSQFNAFQSRVFSSAPKVPSFQENSSSPYGKQDHRRQDEGSYLPKSEGLLFARQQIHTECRDRLAAIYFTWKWRHHGPCLYSLPQDKGSPVTGAYYLAFDKNCLQGLARGSYVWWLSIGESPCAQQGNPKSQQ